MSARKKSTASEKTESLGFEDALAKIEEIVDSMESEQLPLEDLVSQYEKGSALLKHCDSVLASASKRIELITLANREESRQEQYQDPSSNSPNSPLENSEDPDSNNDISLF